MQHLVPFKISGIPALIDVTHIKVIAPRDPRTGDCGEVEIDFEVLDRDGRPAPWLAAKVSDRMADDIREAIVRWYS